MEDQEGRNLYRLKRPCGNCPFRDDKPFYLPPKRAASIARDLRDGNAFHCHKTTYGGSWTYDEEGNERRYLVGGTEAMCAGALITMQKEGLLNMVSRLGIFLGFYDPDTIDLSAPTYGSLDEFVEAKERMDEND